MIFNILEKDKNVKKVEIPTLFQDINVLLAELVGWRHLEIKNESVLVSHSGQNAQKFDFLDKEVILPIAQKYHKEAKKISDSEWTCIYNANGKQMVVVALNEQTSLALALVLEFCLNN